MPNRILREGILDSELVNKLTWAGEVFYRRLMSVVDDFGRFDARPEMLRAKLYPLKIDRVSSSDVSKWLAECAIAGLVSCYEVDNKPYLELTKFNQQIRSQKSKFPANDSRCKQMIANAHLDGDGGGDEYGDVVGGEGGKIRAHEDLIYSVEKTKQLFFEDTTLHEQVGIENKFSAAEIETAKIEFWNTREKTDEVRSKPYNDTQKHFINWSRKNRERIKKEKISAQKEKDGSGKVETILSVNEQVKARFRGTGNKTE